MTHKKTLLFSLIPFAALLLMAASGNLRWDQFRAADKHGTGSYGQSSDGTGASGDMAAFNANGGLTDGGPAGALLSGAANPGIPVIPSVRQAGADRVPRRDRRQVSPRLSLPASSPVTPSSLQGRATTIP